MDKRNQFAGLLKGNLSKNGSKPNKARLQLIAMVIIVLCKVQTVSFHKLAIAFDSKNLSSINRTQVFSLISELKPTMIIFIISHYLEDLERISDQVLKLQNKSVRWLNFNETSN